MKSPLIKVLMICMCAMFAVSCGGSGSNNDSSSGDKSFAAASDPLTIDGIVNGSGISGSAVTGKVTVSEDAEYYYGRFVSLDEYYNMYAGTIRFKMVKYDDNHAYFSDFTLDRLVELDEIDSNTPLVTERTDLEVPSSYDTTSNSITISDATDRFVNFDVDFGNTSAFGGEVTGIHDAGIIFSSDFTTCAGGDDRTFIFIAQKADSQPSVALADALGNWSAINFYVTADGLPVTTSTSTLTIGGTGGNGYLAFTGTNSISGTFGGEMALNDATSGVFFFGYGEAPDYTTATAIHGAFITSADKNLVVGYDASSYLYFAVEKQ